jgi:hypothetical protein
MFWHCANNHTKYSAIDTTPCVQCRLALPLCVTRVSLFLTCSLFSYTTPSILTEQKANRNKDIPLQYTFQTGKLRVGVCQGHPYSQECFFQEFAAGSDPCMRSQHSARAPCLLPYLASCLKTWRTLLSKSPPKAPPAPPTMTYRLKLHVYMPTAPRKSL